MDKTPSKLSKSQLICYRPKEHENDKLSFYEELSLIPLLTKQPEIEKIIKGRLPKSSCVTNGVNYVASGLGIQPTDLKLQQYLLLVSMIGDLGGGVNNGTIVLDVDEGESERPHKKAKKVKLKHWKVFGNEPENLKVARCGGGVGGGMTKVYIWDIKRKQTN